MIVFRILVVFFSTLLFISDVHADELRILDADGLVRGAKNVDNKGAEVTILFGKPLNNEEVTLTLHSGFSEDLLPVKIDESKIKFLNVPPGSWILSDASKNTVISVVIE